MSSPGQNPHHPTRPPTSLFLNLPQDRRGSQSHTTSRSCLERDGGKGGQLLLARKGRYTVMGLLSV